MLPVQGFVSRVGGPQFGWETASTGEKEMSISHTTFARNVEDTDMSTAMFRLCLVFFFLATALMTGAVLAQNPPYVVTGAIAPANRVTAGDTIHLSAQVVDTFGQRQEGIEQELYWAVMDSIQEQFPSDYARHRGPIAWLVPTRQWAASLVRVFYFNPLVYFDLIGDNLTYEVVHALADHLSIEQALTPSNPYMEFGVDTLWMDMGDTVGLFALQRDRFGNNAGPGQGLSWTAGSSNICSIDVGSLGASGAVITAISNGVSEVIVQMAGLQADTVSVMVGSTSSTSSRAHAFMSRVIANRNTYTYYRLDGRQIPSLNIGYRGVVVGCPHIQKESSISSYVLRGNGPLR
jgi:hypothetical protein